MSFKRLEAEDFVVSADAVQSTAWSTGLPTLTEFYTSSVQAAGTSGNYYLSVYQTSSNLSNTAVQFDIAYGNVKGSGSSYFNDALTDSSNNENIATFLGSNRVYQVISGSNGSPYNTTGYVAGSGSYGLFLPDIGTILLNPNAISQSIHVDADESSDLTNGTNQATLYNAILSGESFQLNSQETITSDYVFVRARNSEFNYSENPSFISGSTGEVIYDQFINNPQVYMTTVGMYNDANELIAVAKLSRPLLKDFTKESLVRVKLDF
jgi:hypothetical protein